VPFPGVLALGRWYLSATGCRNMPCVVNRESCDNVRCFLCHVDVMFVEAVPVITPDRYTAGYFAAG